MKYFKVCNPDDEHKHLIEQVFKTIIEKEDSISGKMISKPHYEYVFNYREICSISDEIGLQEEVLEGLSY